MMVKVLGSRGLLTRNKKRCSVLIHKFVYKNIQHVSSLLLCLVVCVPEQQENSISQHRKTFIGLVTSCIFFQFPFLNLKPVKIISKFFLIARRWERTSFPSSESVGESVVSDYALMTRETEHFRLAVFVLLFMQGIAAHKHCTTCYPWMV